MEITSPFISPTWLRLPTD